MLINNSLADRLISEMHCDVVSLMMGTFGGNVLQFSAIMNSMMSQPSMSLPDGARQSIDSIVFKSAESIPKSIA